MVTGSRMSAEERRLSILHAAVPLFARFGFNGTTTKQIAEAAGVSEALLYRHFPGKEALYHELKDFCCNEKKEVVEKIRQLEPSTSTLVHGVYYLVSVIFLGHGHDEDGGPGHESLLRLMVNSYLEDGEFARLFIAEKLQIWESLFTQCVDAAIASGDMIGDWVKPANRWWFVHHLAMALGILHMSKQEVVPYGMSQEELLDEAVRFSLRGMGLTDKAIATYYNPKALSLYSVNLI